VSEGNISSFGAALEASAAGASSVQIYVAELANRGGQAALIAAVALLLIMIPSVVVSWFYAYQEGFIALTLDATLVIAVMFLGTSFAATILPWSKPALYNGSPIARYRIGPIPLTRRLTHSTAWAGAPGPARVVVDAKER
jgi:hypothetical protein